MNENRFENIQLSPMTILRFFLFTIALLLTGNVVGIISKHFLGHGHLYGLVPLFNFDTESNVPTLYSYTTLLLASGLLLLTGLNERSAGRKWLTWLGLSLVFLFLAIDEGSAFHEKFIESLRISLDTSGALYFAWVIPYGAFVLILFLSMIKFLIALPQKTRNLFFISGTTFVLGAIGFEMISGVFASSQKTETLLYVFLTTCEETLEMIGVAIFNYALLDHFLASYKSFQLLIQEG